MVYPLPPPPPHHRQLSPTPPPPRTPLLGPSLPLLLLLLLAVQRGQARALVPSVTGAPISSPSAPPSTVIYSRPSPLKSTSHPLESTSHAIHFPSPPIPPSAHLQETSSHSIHPPSTPVPPHTHPKKSVSSPSHSPSPSLPLNIHLWDLRKLSSFHSYLSSPISLPQESSTQPIQSPDPSTSPDTHPQKPSSQPIQSLNSLSIPLYNHSQDFQNPSSHPSYSLSPHILPSANPQDLQNLSSHPHSSQDAPNLSSAHSQGLQKPSTHLYTTSTPSSSSQDPVQQSSHPAPPLDVLNTHHQNLQLLRSVRSLVPSGTQSRGLQQLSFHPVRFIDPPSPPTQDAWESEGEERWEVGGQNDSLDAKKWDELELEEEFWRNELNATKAEGEWDGPGVGIIVVKGVVMSGIILVAIAGNILVIVSVALHRRLHSPANYLLVSLATADMLVALLAMTFNASVELTGGRWLFGRLMCDLWNSFDVYFSTVSILHLCCISIDRYYAIVRPLEYPLTITRRILAIMLGHCWLAPALISFLPILLGWYTTADHLRARETTPHVCSFVVNAVFALVSSAVSFWVPCTVMVIMYFRIFQEARKQERALLSRASSANSAAYNHSRRAAAQQQELLQQELQQQQQQQQQQQGQGGTARQQLVVALQATSAVPTTRQQEFLMKTFSTASSMTSVATTTSALPPPGPSAGVGTIVGNGTGLLPAPVPGGTNGGGCGRWRYGRHLHNSWHGPTRQAGHPCSRRLHSTPLTAPKTSPLVLGRREHKAARTLGLIMGAFVVCWLPFFVWYVSITICGPACQCPHAVVSTLFWIGYFNSTLNPFIYAYFRTDFREAFHRTLKRLSCCRPRQPTGVFV